MRQRALAEQPAQESADLQLVGGSVETRDRNARVKVTWSRMAAVLALKGVVERGAWQDHAFFLLAVCRSPFPEPGREQVVSWQTVEWLKSSGQIDRPQFF